MLTFQGRLQEVAFAPTSEPILVHIFSLNIYVSLEDIAPEREYITLPFQLLILFDQRRLT
jgi:hypothetical protein